MSGLGADPLDSALIRLRVGSRILGAGFLVAPDVIATCAHVVDGETPVADFPMLRSRDHAVDVLERDDERDIAILRLIDPPPGALPVPVRITGDVRDHRFRTFGFPHDLSDGIWVTGRLVGADGSGRIEMATDPDRWRIEPGFSGAPVWDEKLAGVVGMVATITARHDTTAHMVPTTALGETWTTPASNPYRGLEPFQEEHASWFRGRESLTEQLLDLVGKRPVVVVAGPSGSGKSSLVRAGLIPAVRPLEMDVVVFRALPDGPAVTSLARALLPVLEPELSEQALLAEAESLVARLSTAREQTLPWLAERLLAKAERGGLLVFVDQFEEISAEHPHEAREIFELLEDLAGVAPRQRDGRPTLAVVVTLRSGALDNLVTDRTAASVADGVVFVPPMTRDQLAEAISPAGLVAFEPGLVERILDDAGTEPGTLPLVEFAMTRLWDRRGAGTLTHKTYNELGGVAGALAGFAEDLYKRRLTTTEQAAARRLLIAMARPDENGGFLRRPLRRSDVDDRLLPVLDTLVTARLVVVGRTADGTEIVELAHQALLDRWPRLVKWLAEEREFLAWREQLRAGLNQWLADDPDPGALLRGAALDRAEKWLARDVDLSDEERGYVRASRARERRRLRGLHGVIVVISVLALVASGLAVWAATANEETQQQLRLAHSRALAEESKRARAIDPRMSLQLAQAAWHIAPTSEAYGALLTQYAGMQHVEKVFPNPWQGNLSRIMTSPDGSITAAVNDSGIATTWAGLDGDNPHRGLAGPFPKHLSGGDFQLSPSGKLLAYANDVGAVAVWDLERHTPAVMLRETEGATRAVQSMAFSTDETRLLIKRTADDRETAEFELWDLAHRRTVRIAEDLGPQGLAIISGAVSAFLGPTPDTVVIGMAGGGANVYDVVTGRLVRSVPPPSETSQGHVALNGAVVVQCDRRYVDLKEKSTLRIVDLTTGKEQRSVPVPDCATFSLDTSTNYAISAQSIDIEAAETNSRATITDLRTGRTYRLTAPSLSRGTDGTIAVYSDADGHPVALVGDTNVLYRQRLVAVDHDAVRASEVMLTNPVGNLGANVEPTGEIELINLRTKATVAKATGNPVCWGDCAPAQPFDFSPDGKRLLTVQDDTLVIYSVPSLAVEARIKLPVPAGLGGPPADDGVEYYQWASSLGMVENDRITVLHAGMITRWNLTDRTQIGTPTQVRPDGDGLRRSAHWAVLEPRPGHPDEAVVVHANGTVELWNLDEHRIITGLGQSSNIPGSVRFDRQGSVAAVRTPDGKVQLWDPDQGQKRGRPITAGPGDALGFTLDGKVLTIEDVDPGKAQIWDPDSGKLLATLTGPAHTLASSLEGDRLTMFGREEDRSVEWNPQLWQDTLCRLSDRDYTDDERAVLAQLGAPDDRPCG